MQHAVAFLVYLALWLAMVLRWVVLDFSTSTLSSHPNETSVFVWSLAWWPHAIGRAGNPLLASEVWAPIGLNLAWVTTLPLPALVMAPVTLLFGPFVSFNVLTLLTPPLNAWTAYLLARHVTGALPAALIGGFLFGFSPVVVREVQFGHLNLSMLFVLPLLAYAVIRRVQGTMGRRAFLVVFTILLVAQFGIFIERVATLAVMGSLLAAVAVLAASPGMRPRVVETAGLVAASFVLAGVVVSPYLYTAFAFPEALKPPGFQGLAAGARTVDDLIRFVLPREGMAIGPPVSKADGIGINFWYLGIPLLVLLALQLATAWSYPAKILMGGFLASMVLALGPGIPVGDGRVPLPWTVLGELPLLDRARPGRLVAYGWLFAAVTVAMWLAARDGTWRTPFVRWGLAMAAALLILPNLWADVWARGVTIPPFVGTGLYRRYLCPSENVMVVDDMAANQLYWQSSTAMYFRTATFYGGSRPEDRPDAETALELAEGRFGSVAGPSLRRFVEDHGVTAILVDGDRPAIARRVAAALGSTPREVGGIFLFRVAPCQVEARVSGRGYHPHRT